MDPINFLNMKENKPESLFNYLLNIVITARIETGFRSNMLASDEDVNMYLANLLKHYLSEETVDSFAPYICLYESDLVAKQEQTYDLRQRYNLYKHTADYLLINVGLFGGLRKKLPQYKYAITLSNDIYVGRARAYYAYASEYFRKLKREKTGVSDVLEKLSDNLSVYLNIFYHIRDNHFGLIERFSTGEWFHFVHKNIIRREGVNSKVYVDLMDTFLMHLSAWKHRMDPYDKDMLRIMGEELKRLNPAFNFDVETLVSTHAA